MNEKRKILFIKPKTDLHVVIPPINFLYLCAHLEKHNIRIIDAHNYKISEEKIFEIVKKFNPDIIGLGGLSSEIPFSLDIAKKVRKITKAKIVFGGIHTTNLPEEILENNFIDFIVKGEGEIPFSELVDKIDDEKEYKKISNIGYKKNGKMFFNEMKLYDFNEINMPRWDLINLRDYPKLFLNKRIPCAPIFTSRGCPFSCTYCSSASINGRRARDKNVNAVIEELSYLKERFGIKEFHIWDENFTLKKERAIEFCEKLIEGKLDLTWNCPNGIRVDTLDEGLLKKMKEAGCWAVSLPIEFGTQRMLDVVNKKTNLKKMLRIIPLVEKNGIEATCFFIIGHPEETEEDVIKTIRLSRMLPISRAYFNSYKILPGSADSYKYGKEKNRIIFSAGNKRMKQLQRYALLSFYLRPKQLFKVIGDNMSISQIKELSKTFKHFIMK